MFSYIKEFISRHKKKIIVVGVIIGGAVVGSRYAQRKFVEWQEKEAKEFLERTRKQHYFESTEKTCNQTIIFLSTNLRENIVTLVNCEDVIKKLRESPSNKLELWQDLKVLVFTKVSLLVYAGTLLVIALRIQLNIIGGHIYCKTLIGLSESNPRSTNELQEKYLSQCHHFLNEGIRELYPLVQENVQSALKDISLNRNLTLQNIENIFWAIQSGINSDVRNPLKNMSKLLYGNDTNKEDTMIKEMMLDTIDLLQSSEVVDLASSCVNRGFSNLIDRISEFFLPEENGVSLNAFTSTCSKSENLVPFAHPNHLSKPFAKVIPIINGFGNPAASSDLPEPWITPFIYMDKVKVMGANIYESYSYQK